MSIDQSHKEYVEKMGILLELFGYQRMTGRILGYLMIANPNFQTFDQIKHYLQASKSSISTCLNTLIERNFVVYLTKSGDRKRYFQLNPQGWAEVLATDLKRFGKVKTLFIEAVELRKQQEQDTKFTKHLLEIAHFYAFLEREMPLLLARWNEEKDEKINI